MKFYSILLTLLLFSFSSTSSAITVGFSEVSYIDDIDFEDVNDQLLDEIASHGLVISYTSHAHKMLTRTAPQVNPGYNTYSDALIHLFCAVQPAHDMTNANPHIITGCPYGISVYKTQDRPNGVYLSYRKSSFSEFEPINKLLDQIVSNTKLDLE